MAQQQSGTAGVERVNDGLIIYTCIVSETAYVCLLFLNSEFMKISKTIASAKSKQLQSSENCKT